MNGNGILMTVEEFRAEVTQRLDHLISRLQEATGRTGDEEAAAWRSSLPELAQVLGDPNIAPFHVYLSGRGVLALEYQLPAASSWCDVVLLGRGRTRPAAAVIELKDWTTWGDQPGPYEGLMVRHGNVVLHPSDQVRGYVEYCRRFHSAVHALQADVTGCVLFTRDSVASTYAEPPNENLVVEYPCLATRPRGVRESLAAYVTDRLTSPDEDFAQAFVQGRYHQDRGFVRQIGKQILKPEESPFELLDNQRRAFALVRAELERTLLAEGAQRKRVMLIEGPPGSGKSVLAAKLWATLVTDSRLPAGAVVLTTTSTSQTSNWQRLFAQTARNRAAAGVVKKAASYVPITTHHLGRLRRHHGEHFLSDPANWRENVQLLRNLGIDFQDGAPDGQYLVSIVDEAHALINPEYPEGRGQYGFPPTLGPIAWHIIRASRISIFLLDEAQGFRDRENTTARDLARWAEELGAELSEPISLAGAQFRCAGSKEYVDWIEAVLGGEPAESCRRVARAWQKILDFRIFDTPAALEDALRDRINEGKTARLLASYAREWKTRSAEKPHRLPPSMQDFEIPYVENGEIKVWSRIWNFIPLNGSDYTWFIQAPDGSPMHDDPLCEVGCPYAVRGFDFDYVGVLWLSDLKWRDGAWIADPEHVHETGLNRSLRAARRDVPGGPAREALRDALIQAYRILLTRGIYGVYLWFEDTDTRRRIEECLMQNKSRRDT